MARACGRETWRAGVAPEPRDDAPVPPAGWATAARLAMGPPGRIHPSHPSQLCTRSSGCGSASRLPAQTVAVCLWCPTSSTSARLSSGPPSHTVTKSTVWTLRQFNCHCHFSSPNSLTVSYSKTQSLQPYTIVFPIDYSNLPAGRRPAAESAHNMTLQSLKLSFSSACFWEFDRWAVPAEPDDRLGA